MWAKTAGQITLDSLSGAFGERVNMHTPDQATGVLKGDGLVGGYVVNWTKT